jgi:hypothetical protein
MGQDNLFLSLEEQAEDILRRRLTTFDVAVAPNELVVLPDERSGCKQTDRLEGLNRI